MPVPRGVDGFGQTSRHVATSDKIDPEEHGFRIDPIMRLSMCKESSTRLIVPLVSIALGLFINSAQAQTAPAAARFENQTDATVLSEDQIRPARPFAKTPEDPSSVKSRFAHAARLSPKESPQDPDVDSRGAKPRQSQANPKFTDNTQASRAGRKTAPKSQVVQTSSNVPTTATRDVGLLETLQGVPTGAEHFEVMPNNVNPPPATPKRHIWPFRDFVIPLPTSVGGTVGVPPGCETRCKVEAKFGPPDQEHHASTYFTLVDYSRRGLRFYYDKENRTISFSKFPPVSLGGMPPSASPVRIVDSKPEY
jgi:hypothetical protein